MFSPITIEAFVLPCLLVLSTTLLFLTAPATPLGNPTSLLGPHLLLNQHNSTLPGSLSDSGSEGFNTLGAAMTPELWSHIVAAGLTHAKAHFPAAVFDGMLMENETYWHLVFDLPNHVRASFTTTLNSRSRIPEFVSSGVEYFDHPLREKEELYWPPRFMAVQALQIARDRGFRGSLSHIDFYVAEYKTGHLPIYGFCPAGEDNSAATWLSAVSGRTLGEPPGWAWQCQVELSRLPSCNSRRCRIRLIEKYLISFRITRCSYD